MHDLNRVQLIGHLGQDPEVTYTATGTARTTFSVATSQRRKDADGQVQEATEWTRYVAWRTLGEVCPQYVTKGSHVYVSGRLHTQRWQDAATGERHARVEIVLDDLILLDRPRTDEALDGDTAQAPAVPASNSAPDATDGPPRRPGTPPGVQPRPPPGKRDAGAAAGADPRAARPGDASHRGRGGAATFDGCPAAGQHWRVGAAGQWSRP